MRLIVGNTCKLLILQFIMRNTAKAALRSFIPVNVLRTAPYSEGSCISYLFTIYNRGFLQYVCAD